MSFGDFLADIIDPQDIFGRRAGEEAGDIQRRTTERGLNEQRELFDQLQEDKAPVLEAQNYAIELLRQLSNGETQLAPSPGLAGLIDDNQRSLRSSLAARGKLNSGDRYIGEQDIAAQLTSQDNSNRMSRLLNLAGFATGDTATQNSFLSNNANNQAYGQTALNTLSNNRRINSINNRNSGLNDLAFVGGTVNWQNFMPQQNSTMLDNQSLTNFNQFANYS